MKENWETIQAVFATVGGLLGLFVGGLDEVMIALITFMVVDYITGVTVAIVNKNLSSEIGFKGLFKKVLIVVLVGIGNIIDTYVLKTGSMLRLALIFFYLSNEGISILENTAKLGLPIPEKLRSVLEQLKEDKKESE